MTKIKNSSKYQWGIWLGFGVFFTILGLQLSCIKEDNFNQNIEIIVQIPIPDKDNLKSGTAVEGIQRVVLTVSSANEKPIPHELTINGITASGTISILPGKNIKFTAEAIDGNGIVQWQGTKTMDVVGTFTVDIELAPIPPSTINLQGLQVGKSVNLSWNQNTDPDIARYNLYRSQSDTSLGTVIHSITVFSETAFTDNTVSEGRTYYYTLGATDTEGFNTKSNQVRVDIPFIHPSASVLKVDSVGKIVSLSWTQNTDKDFARYELYRSQSANLLGTVVHSDTVATNTVYRDNKVLEGQSYYYRIAVLDNDGFNTRSDSVLVEVPLNPPTASTLYGSEDGGYVYLSWTKNTDSDFARYELYRSDNNSDLGTLIDSTSVVTNLLFEDSQVIEGKTYYYTLKVVDENELSTNSNVAQIEIPVNPPMRSKLEGGNDGIYAYMYWSQNYDSDFAKYDLYRSESEKLLGSKIYSTKVNTEISFEDYPLEEGKTYYYTLIVFDKAGYSTESNVVTIYIPVTPPTASALRGNFNGENCKIYFTWTQNYDSDFAKYELYRSTTNKDWGTLIHPEPKQSVTSFIDDDSAICKYIYGGGVYYYRLIVYNTDGNYTISNVEEFSSF